MSCAMNEETIVKTINIEPLSSIQLENVHTAPAMLHLHILRHAIEISKALSREQHIIKIILTWAISHGNRAGVQDLNQRFWKLKL